MKSIVTACLFAWLVIVPSQAQTKKKSTKNKSVKIIKPAKSEDRPIAANPVVEGDPITKPDNRIVSANPIVEGDPMIPDDRISIHDVKAKLDSGASMILIDVRSVDDWKSASTKIKTARRVTIEEIEKQQKSWQKSLEIIAYCACSDDTTILLATERLKKAGFKNVKALWGGWNAWIEAGYPTEPK